ncbi:hypothetical protein D3C83_124880 [compost metagenome]
MRALDIEQAIEQLARPERGLDAGHGVHVFRLVHAAFGRIAVERGLAGKLRLRQRRQRAQAGADLRRRVADVGAQRYECSDE